MNKVIMMGRLTRDPEVRYSIGTNQTAIANFSLAVDRRWKREGEPNADFFNCVAFGKQSEFIEKYLRQGTKIVITGRIQNENYTTKEGQKVYAVKILVEEIDFAESKNAQASNNTDSSPYQADSRPSPSQAASDGFMSIPDGVDDGLPFN